MLHPTTLSEISTNINTGIEYEIALFHQLLENKPEEQLQVLTALSTRTDAEKIKGIISKTDISDIKEALKERKLTFSDASFETQNDGVGPADIVLIVLDENGKDGRIGLSVKYSNTCTLNVTGRNFITEKQISNLQKQLPNYIDQYIVEMTQKYGSVKNWFRKRIRNSETTNAYIDLIRDAVIANWKNVNNKESLLSTLFHNDSPIEFWVVTYGKRGYTLRTKPQTIDRSRANDVTIGKHLASFIAFYLDNTMVGHMQVKFNDGILERCKKSVPDITHQGIKMTYGRPFTSWNFSVEK